MDDIRMNHTAMRIKAESEFEGDPIQKEIQDNLNATMNYYADAYNIPEQETVIESERIITLPEIKQENTTSIKSSNNQIFSFQRPDLNTNVNKLQIEVEKASVFEECQDNQGQNPECYISCHNLPRRPRRTRSIRSFGSDFGSHDHNAWRSDQRAWPQAQFNQNYDGFWNNPGQCAQNHETWFTDLQMFPQSYETVGEYHCPGCNCFRQFHQQYYNWNNPRSRPY